MSTRHQSRHLMTALDVVWSSAKLAFVVIPLVWAGQVWSRDVAYHGDQDAARFISWATLILVLVGIYGWAVFNGNRQTYPARRASSRRRGRHRLRPPTLAQRRKAMSLVLRWAAFVLTVAFIIAVWPMEVDRGTG